MRLPREGRVRVRGRPHASVVNELADLARRMGVSRVRVTQQLNLLKLPLEIQHEVLSLLKKNSSASVSGASGPSRCRSHREQLKAFERLKSRLARK